MDRRASGNYRGRYTDATGQVHSKTFATRGDARRWVNARLVAVARGEHIDDREARSITLEQWCARWLEEPGKRPSTLARDSRVLRTHVYPLIGKRPLASLTPADVRRVVKVIQGKVKATTVRTNYGVLRAALAAAVEAELILRSPCRGVKLVHEERRAPVFLEHQQIDQLADAMPPEYRAMVYVAGVLGLRWSEVAGLRVGRVNFFDRTVTVDQAVTEVNGQIITGSPKTHAGRRTMKMPRIVADELTAHLARRGITGADPEALVFVAPDGGPLRPTNFRRRVWAPAIKRAELSGLTFHGLRHTAVGLLIKRGEHPRVIQQRMGHASFRTTMEVYGSVPGSVDAAVANGLDELWAPPGEVVGLRH